jgi:hypothetical protein
MISIWYSKRRKGAYGCSFFVFFGGRSCGVYQIFPSFAVCCRQITRRFRRVSFPVIAHASQVSLFARLLSFVLRLPGTFRH